MTIEQKIAAMLYNNGMFPEQAIEVVGRMKQGIPEMEGRWSDYADGYPAIMMAVLWLAAKNYAVAWIDENLPLAWYRPLFAK